MYTLAIYRICDNIRSKNVKKIIHLNFIKCLYEIKNNCIFEVFFTWIKIPAIIVKVTHNCEPNKIQFY